LRGGKKKRSRHHHPVRRAEKYEEDGGTRSGICGRREGKRRRGESVTCISLKRRDKKNCATIHPVLERGEKGTGKKKTI